MSNDNVKTKLPGDARGIAAVLGHVVAITTEPYSSYIISAQAYLRECADEIDRLRALTGQPMANLIVKPTPAFEHPHAFRVWYRSQLAGNSTGPVPDVVTAIVIAEFFSDVSEYGACALGEVIRIEKLNQYPECVWFSDQHLRVRGSYAGEAL